MNLTAKDWEAAFSEARRETPDIEEGAVTVRELCIQSGMGEKKIAKYLRDMIGRGRVAAKSGRRIAIDGTMRHVPVYILKGEGGEP